MRLAPLLLILAGAIACEEGGAAVSEPEPTPDPDPPHVVGQYNLAQVNGKELPTPEGCDWRYTFGELGLKADSTFDGQIVRREDCGDIHGTSTSNLGGEYSVRADSTIAEDHEDMRALRFVPIGNDGSIQLEWRVDQTHPYDELLFNRL